MSRQSPCTALDPNTLTASGHDMRDADLPAYRSGDGQMRVHTCCVNCGNVSSRPIQTSPTTPCYCDSAYHPAGH